MDISVPSEDFPPGSSRLVTVDGNEVALFNVEGRLYAVGNRCPHRSGPLARGKIEPAPETGEPAVRCPIHGWLFDLKSGRCLTRPRACVPTYPISCSDGQILLGPPQGEASGPSASGLPPAE